MKEIIQINSKEKTELKTIIYGVPQGSILGPLLFLLYIIDLKNASYFLDPIMFADDTNLLLTYQDITYPFEMVNLGLLDKHSFLSMYHSYIHSYINYGNIAWGSTIRANLKKYISDRNILQIDCYILEQTWPSASFRYKRKAKKRAWNTSNRWLKFIQTEGIFFRINYKIRGWWYWKYQPFYSYKFGHLLCKAKYKNNIKTYE